MKKRLSVLFAALLALHCGESELQSRLNPYDPNGENWTKNVPPKVSLKIGTVWNDFDHELQRGEISLNLKCTDPNIPADTLRFKLFTGSSPNDLDLVYESLDPINRINDLELNKKYFYRLEVSDTWDSVSIVSDSFRTPASVPPSAPRLSYNVNYNSIVNFSWNRIPESDTYYVYTSDSLSGPYTRIDTITENYNSNVNASDTLNEYRFYYYLVSSVNNYGECRSKDTISVRRSYPGLSTPTLYSVSQGTYSKYIQITWSTSYNTPYYYEIYRSLKSAGPYTCIGKLYPTNNYSTPIYYDTVPTTQTYYYKIASVDRQGRGSGLSSPYSGYISRLYAPNYLYAEATDSYIWLRWSSVNNAAKYSIYRSSTGCSSDFVKIGTSKTTTYYDSVKTAAICYYKIAAVDTADNDGSLTSCASASLTRLPQPLHIRASDGLYSNHILVEWLAVDGADRYIIYRSDNGSTFSAIDTVSDPVYIDSTCIDSSIFLYYYRVAAHNEICEGYQSAYDSGYRLKIPAITLVSNPYCIELSWSSLSNSICYYIYRSTNSTSYTLIDSTVHFSYTDSVRDYKNYSYRLAVRTAQELTRQGPAVSGIRTLTTPQNFLGTETEHGVCLSWNKSPDAEWYVISKHVYSNSSTFVVDSTTDTTWFDSLDNMSRFYYSVRAHNRKTSSIWTQPVLRGVIQAPATPSSFSVSGFADQITLTWAEHTTGSPVSKYYIYRSHGSPSGISLYDSTTETVYYDSVSENVFYYYSIAAVNSAGMSSKTASMSGKLTVPPQPYPYWTSAANLASYVRLLWGQSIGADGYNIYRSPVSNMTYEKIASTSDTFYLDSSAIPGFVYKYYIRAFNVAGEGSQTGYGECVRIAPPQQVSIGQSYEYISVSWDQPTSYAIAKYYIYHASSDTGPFTKIDSCSAPPYLDSLSKTTYNYYKISACNFEESALSSASHLAQRLFPNRSNSIVATAGTQTDAIHIIWNPSVGADGYRLFRSTDSSFSSGINLVVDTNAISYVDSVFDDSLYYYKVKAYNPGGESPLSVYAMGFRTPSAVPLAPEQVRITDSVGIYLHIVWTLPEESSPATSYSIYRSESVTGDYTLIGSATGQGYTDAPPLSYPSKYWYRIKASNQVGDSEFSTAISGSRW